MKTLNFTYRTDMTFSVPVTEHQFNLRCVPSDSDRQNITRVEYRVYPEAAITRLTDGFGNAKLSGSVQEPHSEFGFCVTGTAETNGMQVVREPLHAIYKYPSRYTRFEPEIVRFAEAAYSARRTNIPSPKSPAGEAMAGKRRTQLREATAVMNYLHEHFTYAPGVTDIHTTAAEALRLGKGVCQDYAHILIAVLRYLGIPARYVNGMMIGEGYTHAWVEVYTDGGWYGLDPTNNLHIDAYYIKLAHGRDYADCVVDKGRFLGNALQQQKIYVNVEEAK